MGEHEATRPGDPAASAAEVPALGVSGRIARAFQANAITPLLALVALLLGVFAVLVTPREEEPQINVTMANVLIPFPGASSIDVQNMVARPAEQVLSQIAGIEHTYSIARPGLAVLTVQFQVGVPRTEALVRLYDVLNANQDWLPRDLGTLAPIVRPKGIDDVPVLAVTLWRRDATSAVELERIAHALEAELERVPGAREVQTIGGPGRVVSVALEPVRLRERGLDLAQLRKALAGANLGMPAGLSSLVMQTQVFFTIGLAIAFAGDRLQRRDALGAIVAAAGVVVLGAYKIAEGATGTFAGFVAILVAAFAWAAGNLIAKRAGADHQVDGFSLVVWSSLVPPIPLALVSFAFEGGAGAFAALAHASWLTWACLLVMAWGATLFGFGAWNRLLHHYPMTVVSPFALLVPVSGLASGAILLGERLSIVQAAGVLLVLAGLAVNVLGPAVARRLSR